VQHQRSVPILRTYGVHALKETALQKAALREAGVWHFGDALLLQHIQAAAAAYTGC
jgi:hypothetical protein